MSKIMDQVIYRSHGSLSSSHSAASMSSVRLPMSCWNALLQSLSELTRALHSADRAAAHGSSWPRLQATDCPCFARPISSRHLTRLSFVWIWSWWPSPFCHSWHMFWPNSLHPWIVSNVYPRCAYPKDSRLFLFAEPSLAARFPHRFWFCS